MARGAFLTPLALLALALVGLPVVQADDPDPPVFKSITLQPGPYGPGDEVPFQVRWEDASGIDQVWASAIGPADLRVHGVSCEDPQDERVAIVDCVLRLPARAPGGAYKVDQVSAYDVVGHSTSTGTDATFTVESPYDDRDGPLLADAQQNLTRLEMQQLTPEWGHVRIPQAFFVGTSDASNVSYAGMQFEGPNGNTGVWVQCERLDDAGKEMACTAYADPEMPAGDYLLRSVHLQDEIGYMSYYHYGGWSSSSWKDLSVAVPTPFRIEVVTPYVDDDAPVLTGLTFPGRLHRGQPFEVRINATDETATEYVHVYFRTTRGNAGYSVGTYAACEREGDADLRLVCTGRFPDNFPLGLALVDWVNVVDIGHNWGWLRPVEVGGTQPGHHFQDDDRFDVGTVLVPRPIEGVVEAIDAVVNEVLPGDVATLVYHVEDTVDDVRFVLQDAVDGSTVEVACLDAVLTQLGTECAFEVPADEDGVLSLVSATTVTDAVATTSTYAAGEVPLLAVNRAIPKADALPLATGGGALNTVGHDWAATFQEAQAAAQKGADAGPTKEPPQAPTQPAPTPDPQPAPAGPVVLPADPPVTYTFTPTQWANASTEAAPQAPRTTRAPIEFAPGEDAGGPEQEAPLPLAVVVLGLLIALRRRGA